MSLALQTAPLLVSTFLFPFSSNNCQSPKFSTPAAVWAMHYCWKQHILNLKPCQEHFCTSTERTPMLCHANQGYRLVLQRVGKPDSEQVATHERGAGLPRSRLLQGSKKVLPADGKQRRWASRISLPMGVEQGNWLCCWSPHPWDVLHLTFGLHNTKLIIYFKRLSIGKEYVPITNYVIYP